MAHMYLSIAADSGHENAIEDRDSIAKKNDPITVSRGTKISTRMDAEISVNNLWAEEPN